MMATVRMRGNEWEISATAARMLEKRGVLWIDHDCVENSIANGMDAAEAALCYGVSGESESPEEDDNAALLDEIVRLSNTLTDAFIRGDEAFTITRLGSEIAALARGESE
jgi:hypothetical protein